MAKYRKKPVEVDAIKLNTHNVEDVLDFMGVKGLGAFHECGYGIDPADGQFKITTLEGVMVASIGDYIIKGVQGEFYPCKPDIFEQTYDKVI
jgi:hypothetical protein